MRAGKRGSNVLVCSTKMQTDGSTGIVFKIGCLEFYCLKTMKNFAKIIELIGFSVSDKSHGVMGLLLPGYFNKKYEDMRNNCGLHHTLF